MESVRHIVWDWNGTLLDDVWLCLESINVLLRDHRLEAVDEAAYRAHFDFPVIRYYEHLGFDIEEKRFADVSERFIRYYECRRDTLALQSDTQAVLEAVQAAGYSQSVLSAYRQDGLDEVIRVHGLDRFFTERVGLDNNLAHGKVEIGRQWISRSGLEPAEVLMVGDTLHDFEVAKAMGIHCWLVSHGHHDRLRLEQTGVPVLPSLRAVEERLRETSGRTPIATNPRIGPCQT